MQRSIFRLVGACGLIFTINAAAQNAGSGGASVGVSGAPATGANAGGTISAGANAGRTGNATASQGQNISTFPGQSISTTPQTIGVNGQPVQGQSPAGQANATTAGISSGVNATTAGTTIGSNGATAPIGTRSTVSLNALPANVQSQIAAQIPAGAQLGGIITEQTAQGTTYRAQVMQNGVISEVALNGIAATATAPGLTGTLPLATGGFVVGTAYPFESLPGSVQAALAAQGAAGVAGTTFTPLGNGGLFRTMVDGRPVEVRVGPNGQILPILNRAVAATAPSNTATNTLRFDDLPQAVRDAIRAGTPYAEVTSVRRTDSASGGLYDITLREKDRLSLMRLSENGTIVNERHELAASLTGPAPVLTNEPPKLAWNSLPVAVREAISSHAQQEAIRALVLTNHMGKTAFAVDYTDRDTLRNRLYIGKDGLVMDTQTNLFGIATTGKAVVLEDLPAPARAVVELQAERSAVTRIDLAMRDLTPVYVITYGRDGETRQMVVSRDGRRMDSAVGAPASFSIGGAEEGLEQK